MNTQLIVHQGENSNPFDHSIEEILTQEGSVILVSPYFSIHVIQNICQKLSSKLLFLTDLQEIKNNLTHEKNLNILLDLINQNKIELFDICDLHAKVLTRGNKSLIGSANFTGSGLGKNHEASVLIEDSTIANNLQSWVSYLIKDRNPVTSDELKQAFQVAPTLQTIPSQESQQNLSNSAKSINIHVPSSKLSTNFKPQDKDHKILPEDKATIQTLLSIFPDKHNLIAAKLLVNQLKSIVNDDEILKKLLSITIPIKDKNRLRFNLGNWEVLQFKKISNDKFLRTSLCLDYTEYSHWIGSKTWQEDLEIHDINFDGKHFRQFLFEPRWSEGKDFRTISFIWNSENVLSEKLINKWHSAIIHTTRTFRNWKSSSYMRWHRPILADILLSEDNTILESLYLPNFNSIC